MVLYEILAGEHRITVSPPSYNLKDTDCPCIGKGKARRTGEMRWKFEKADDTGRYLRQCPFAAIGPDPSIQ